MMINKTVTCSEYWFLVGWSHLSMLIKQMILIQYIDIAFFKTPSFPRRRRILTKQSVCARPKIVVQLSPISAISGRSRILVALMTSQLFSTLNFLRKQRCILYEKVMNKRKVHSFIVSHRIMGIREVQNIALPFLRSFTNMAPLPLFFN